jgi:hypothetical protein
LIDIRDNLLSSRTYTSYACGFLTVQHACQPVNSPNLLQTNDLPVHLTGPLPGSSNVPWNERAKFCTSAVRCGTQPADSIGPFLLSVESVFEKDVTSQTDSLSRVVDLGPS